jgi:hypothetical protein
VAAAPAAAGGESCGEPAEELTPEPYLDHAASLSSRMPGKGLGIAQETCCGIAEARTLVAAFHRPDEHFKRVLRRKKTHVVELSPLDPGSVRAKLVDVLLLVQYSRNEDHPVAERGRHVFGERVWFLREVLCWRVVPAV